MVVRRSLPLRCAIGTSLLLCACQLQVGGSGGEPQHTTVEDGGQVSETDRVNQAAPDAAAVVHEPRVDASVVPHEELDASHGSGLTDAATDAAAAAQDGDVYDAEADAGELAADGAVRGDATVSPDGAAQMCSLTGSFATELLFDVGWNQTTLAGILPLLAADTGQIRIAVRLDLGGSPDHASARLTACGATLPDFKASNALIGTEYYGAYVPESAWDNAAMPHPAFGLSFGCSDPGCALTTDPVVATFGARTLPNDVWPGRSGSLKQITPLDHDGDGLPGVTFVSRGADERNALGMAYVHIPVTWTLGARAPEAGVAFRITGLFSGKIANCDLLSGVVGSGTVEARAVGCRTRREGASAASDCSAEQSSFLDQNLPDWQVRGGTFRALRVANDASCAAVRAALQ